MVNGAKAAKSVAMVQCSCPAVSVVESVEKLGEEVLKW